MANFIIVGAGQIGHRSTNLAGFDGVTFSTIGNATALINTTLINGANITASAFNDTLDIFVGPNATYTGQAFSFTSWSANDLVVFRDAEEPFNTSAGDETITGTGQRDRFHLGGGNDSVSGGSGEDVLSLYYRPYTAAFVMANGNTKITDNGDNSVSFSSIERFDIDLGSGDDVIVLGAGADRIFGNDGDDSLNTGTGAAIVNGGNGTDRWSADLSAFSGAFTIDLSLSGLQNIGNGSSLDSIEVMTIIGGSGNDSLKSRVVGEPDSPFNDIIDGSAGDDTVLVGGGVDTAAGGAGGNDLLIIDYDGDSEAFFMANGNTTITDGVNTSVSFSGFERYEYRGSIGVDTIVLGGGADIAFGGNGDDSLDTGAGAATVDGGVGTDKWSANLSAFAGAFTFNANLAGVQNIGNGTSIQSVEHINVTGGTGNDAFTTRSGDAPIWGDTVNGFDGDDTISVAGGIDVVNGGIGNDLLIIDYSGQSAASAFVMAAGNTRITDNVDTSVTFSDFERFDYRGAEGVDAVILGAGFDIVNGNAGDDSLNTAAGAATVDGGAGTDLWSANLAAFAGAFALNLNLGGVQNIGNGSSVQRIERLNVVGGGGNDTFETVRSSTLARPGLNDVIDGSAGNDTITVSCAIDTAIGGSGDDLLIVDYSGETAAFVMASGNTVITNNANVSVTFSEFERLDYRGGFGADSIVLGAGADIASGGIGADTFTGGLGADILDGGANVDTADYSEKTSAVVVFLNGGADAVVTVGGAAEDTIRAFENLNGGSGGDSLVGDGAQNLLRGNGGADFLFSNGFNPDGTMKSGAGNDTLEGGAGDDGLYGGDGVDTLHGGDGADGMVGGGSSDTLNGGAGGDFLFGGSFTTGGAFAPNSGNDTLNGGDGNDGLYGFDGADTINGDVDNDYVEGGAGDDVVNGGAGSDYLLGQDNADAINGGTGFDYLYGGTGADAFIFRKGDSADWILDFNAAQGDKLRFLDFGYANFAAVPLVDLSTPGNPAVQLTFSGPGGVDQLTVFGATLAQLNATNVLVA